MKGFILVITNQKYILAQLHEFLCYFLSVAQKQYTKQQEAVVSFNVSSWSPVNFLNIVRITSVTQNDGSSNQEIIYMWQPGKNT